MLSSALHDAKDNNLEQTAPELVRQAEDALQEVRSTARVAFAPPQVSSQSTHPHTHPHPHPRTPARDTQENAPMAQVRLEQKL